jgi:TonB family protein
MLHIFLLLFLWPLWNAQGEKQSPEDILARWMLGNTKLPLYSDQENRPIWFDSQQLKERAVHCERPDALPLGRRARINGKVRLAILVNTDGKVEDIRLISGHPLLSQTSMEATKKWTFKSLKIDGKALAFCGLLEFHFAAGNADHAPDPCLCVHW